MSYDKNETMKNLILDKLREVEKRENVKILYAAESGSRAWGVESPDSDYDVRFIYVRPLKYYLQLQEKKDFIDWELNEILDINGWDLTKTLVHFHRSNATLFEWANSPVVYCTTDIWEEIMETANGYFSCKSSMYHYYGTARKNYQQYLTEELVKYKKYFYVLRPILACRWIEKKKCPPPVCFGELAAYMLEEEMKEHVERLVQQKIRMTEAEKKSKIEVIDNYIVEKLNNYKELLGHMEDDRKESWEELNRLFLKIVGTDADIGFDSVEERKN